MYFGITSRKRRSFDWSKQRSLRHFLELCKDENLPVVLRIGPFCHGEVRCGGIPDWILEKNVELRSEDPKFYTMSSCFIGRFLLKFKGFCGRMVGR